MRRVKKGLALLLSTALLITGMQLTPMTANAQSQEGTTVQLTSEQNQTDSSVEGNSIEASIEETLAGETTTEEASVKETSETETSETEETVLETTTSEEASEVETVEEETTEEETTEEETTEEETSEEEVLLFSRMMSLSEQNYATEEVASIKYVVSIANSDGATSLQLAAQDSSWNMNSKEFEINGDGNYEFTLKFNYEKGMKNLGFVTFAEGSPMTVTVEKLVLNDMYELPFETPVVLQVGEGNNGLANMWNATPQAMICGTDAAYLALDKANGDIRLYVLAEEPQAGVAEAQTLSTIQYQFGVTGVTDESAITFIATPTSWNNKSAVLELTGDGDYSVTLKFDDEEGVTNLGYVVAIEGSQMEVTLKKLIINGTYELTYDTAPVMLVGDGEKNGLSNIWNTSPETKICGDEQAYFKSSKSGSEIIFYAVADKQTDDAFTRSDVSLKYVQAMGNGWNLGNSFDGFDSDTSKADMGELAWGNPTVTKELIQAVKAKGYDSIRIPMTMYRRYTVNENAADDEIKYVADEAWLQRYKEVVDWAVEEGLYVMINLHHDSWIWLSEWDGNKSSEEYRRFTDLWKQLAAYLAEEPEQVCFETINEPNFTDGGDYSAQEKLNEINLAAYEIIRDTKGNETRMIIMPTLNTNHEKCTPLYRLIDQLQDDYIIATVHYYSEWVYSANLGKTGFDEELWLNNGESYTPRVAAETMMNTITEQFTNRNIGVIIGEYGLLGYDQSEGCLETGEELKYYEYMNELARRNQVCLMFWDNGSGIDRRDSQYAWKKQVVGEMLESSMQGRSSYATGLDNLYFAEETQEDVEIPLTLNGNTFEGIQGLTQGVEYTYENETVTLKKEYVNEQLQKLTGYGTCAELVMKFSSGADWHEYLVKYAAPTVGSATGTTSAGIQIPVTFNGSKVRRMTAYQDGGRVGPNSSWWAYLQYDGSFGVNYEKGYIELFTSFFQDETVKDGELELAVEFFDGRMLTIKATIQGTSVTSGTPSSNPDNTPSTGTTNQESQEQASEQTSTVTTTQTQTPVQAPAVVIAENEVALAAGTEAALGVTQSVSVTISNDEKELQLALLAKYYEDETYRQNTMIYVYADENAGATIFAADLAAQAVNAEQNVEQSLNLHYNKQVLPALGTESVVYYQAVKPSEYQFNFGIHFRLGQEYAGKKAQIYVRTSADAIPVLVAEQTVNEIGNIAYSSNQVADVIVLIAE